MSDIVLVELFPLEVRCFLALLKTSLKDLSMKFFARTDINKPFQQNLLKSPVTASAFDLFTIINPLVCCFLRCRNAREEEFSVQPLLWFRYFNIVCYFLRFLQILNQLFKSFYSGFKIAILFCQFCNTLFITIRSCFTDCFEFGLKFIELFY